MISRSPFSTVSTASPLQNQGRLGGAQGRVSEITFPSSFNSQASITPLQWWNNAIWSDASFGSDTQLSCFLNIAGFSQRSGSWRDLQQWAASDTVQHLALCCMSLQQAKHLTFTLKPPPRGLTPISSAKPQSNTTSHTCANAFLVIFFFGSQIGLINQK